MTTEERLKAIEEHFAKLRKYLKMDTMLMKQVGIHQNKIVFILVGIVVKMVMLIYVLMEWVEGFVQNVEKEQRRNF